MFEQFGFNEDVTTGCDYIFGVATVEGLGTGVGQNLSRFLELGCKPEHVRHALIIPHPDLLQFILVCQLPHLFYFILILLHCLIEVHF